MRIEDPSIQDQVAWQNLLQHLPPISSLEDHSQANSAGIQVAFFDLDRTVIDYNSGKSWAYSEWKAGYINFFQLMKACYWLLQYHLGWSKLEHALEQAIAMLTGLSEADFVHRVEQFYHKEVKVHYRPEALACIRYFQRQNIPTVLLTTSSSYLSDHVQQDLALSDILANSFQVEGGYFTGKSKGIVCFGEGKSRAADHYLSQHKIDVKNSAFYTDSYSDVSFLSRVGYPYSVCPDQKLKTWSLQNKVPILHWSSALK